LDRTCTPWMTRTHLSGDNSVPTGVGTQISIAARAATKRVSARRIITNDYSGQVRAGVGRHFGRRCDPGIFGCDPNATADFGRTPGTSQQLLGLAGTTSMAQRMSLFATAFSTPQLLLDRRYVSASPKPVRWYGGRADQEGQDVLLLQLRGYTAVANANRANTVLAQCASRVAAMHAAATGTQSTGAYRNRRDQSACRTTASSRLR